MAEKKATTVAGTVIDPAAFYLVRLAAVADYAKARLSPRHNPHQMKGKAVIALKDKISDVRPVE